MAFNPNESFEVLDAPPGFDPAQPFEAVPASNRAADVLKRIPEGMATGTGRTLQGIARGVDIVSSLGEQQFLAAKLGAVNQKAFPQITPATQLLTFADVPEDTLADWRKEYHDRHGGNAREERLQGSTLYRFGEDIAANAREFYNTDRARDPQFTAQLATAAGEMVPTLITGALTGPVGAGVQYGIAAGQSGAEEALAAGRPDAADTAYLMAAGIGGGTEAAIGVPGRLFSMARRARAAGVAPSAFKTWLRATGEGTVREGVQESLEEFGGNVSARDVAGYDPQRALGRNVGRAAALGATLGGIVGGGAALVNGNAPTPAPARVPPFNPDAPFEVVTPPNAEGVAPFIELPSEAVTPAAVVPQIAQPLPEVAPYPTPLEGQPYEVDAVPAAGGDAGIQQSTQSAAAGPESVAPPAVKRKVVRRREIFNRETELVGGHDILDWLVENGGILSRTRARRVKSGEWYQRNQSLWDDAAPLARPHHNVIYEGAMYPDQAAQAAYDAGVLKTPDVNDFWEAVHRSSQRRAKVFETQRTEAKALKAQEQEYLEWVEATSRGAQEVRAHDLQVGEELQIGGEKFKVVMVDKHTGDVTIKDGPRFGYKAVAPDEILHVEKYHPNDPDWSVPEEPGSPSALQESGKRGKVERASQTGNLQGREQPRNTGGRKLGDPGTRPLTGDPVASPERTLQSPAPEAPPIEAREWLQARIAATRGELIQDYARPYSGRLARELATLESELARDTALREARLSATRSPYAAPAIVGETIETRPLSAGALREEAPSPSRTSGMGDPLGSPAAPPIPAPAPPPGTTMLFDARLPVTVQRTGPGSVSVPQVMTALVRVQQAAGSLAGTIRTGRFTKAARGIFKPHEEIIRLHSADNIPTAVHEVGHALQKQIYGTSKASGLKALPGDVRRELVGMGKALYGSKKPNAGYSGEGFAEFMRYWLTTEDAGKVAPRTTAFFEGQVLPKYPEVAGALADARGVIDIWRRQGSLERAQRQLVREPGTFARVARALGHLVSYQSQMESFAPLEAVSKAATIKRGKPLPPSHDPFKLASWKRGTAGAVVERMAVTHMLDVWGNPVGPSLSEALAPVRAQRSEFALYLFARRALERWSQNKNPGISREDAQFIKGLYDKPEFQLAAGKYYQWWDGLLDYVVQADPAMSGVVAKVRASSHDYAPLARLIDPAQARSAAAQAKANPLMRMHGSGLPVKDIFDQTFINAARLVNRAHQAMVLNAVVNVAEIPGLGHLIEEVPKEQAAQRVNFEKLRGQLEELGVDTSAMPADEILTYYSVMDAPRGSAPILAVKRADGVHWYQVDARLYDALEGLQNYSLKNAFPNLPALGVALDLTLGAPSRAFRLGTTGLRAPFSLITNPVRDLPTGLAQTSVNPARFAAEYPAALAAVIRGGLGGKTSPHVQAFYDLGAHMGQPLGIDIAHTQRVSNELFHGRFLRVVKNPVDHLRQLFSIPEAAPRIAELAAVASEVGWTPGTRMTPDQSVQMALAAKRVTIDFSAAGDVSRVLNAAVPFYNPAVQGLRSFGRAFQQHPLRSVLLGLAAFTVPALLNWWRNKDEEWFRALPWRERYTYTNIDDGTNVWRIPRPFEWGNAFMVMPEALLDSWYRRDPEGVRQAIGHIFESTNPLDYPVLAKIAKEQWQNRIDFWDRPIVPRGEEDLPPAMQAGPYTSKLATSIAHAFPEASPRRIDAALRSYFGGVASDVISGLGLGPSKIDREWERSDIPVLGVLFRRGGEFNAQNQHIADFYDAYLPAAAKLNAVREQAKRQAMGQPTGPPVELTAVDAVAAKMGEDASQAITVLLRMANSTRDLASRRVLYKEAGDLALQVTKAIGNAENQKTR